MGDVEYMYRRVPVNQGDIEIGLGWLVNKGVVEGWEKAVVNGRVWYNVRMTGQTGVLRDGLTVAETGAVVDALRYAFDK